MEEGVVRKAVANKAVEGLSSRGTSLLWRGILTVLFGFAALFWPDKSLKALIYIAGGYLVFDGVVTAVMALRDGALRDWLVPIIVSIAAGAAILMWPQETGKILLIILGVWAIIQGINLFMAGRNLKQDYDEGSLLIYVGIALLIVGVAALFWQNVAATAIAWLIGLIAIVIGAVEIFLATKLRSLPDKLAAARDDS